MSSVMGVSSRVVLDALPDTGSDRLVGMAWSRVKFLARQSLTPPSGRNYAAVVIVIIHISAY